MKLYLSPGACSQAVHIALHEARLHFDVEHVNLKDHKTRAGRDYYEINPKGYVPTLELDDGKRLTEVQVLLQYVADLAPGAKLAPVSGSFERYRLQEWLSFISSEIHKAFGPLFHPAPEETKKESRERILRRFEYVDDRLANRHFLMGEHFGVADAYLYVMMRWARSFKLEIGGLKNVEALFARIDGRLSVKAALEAEGISQK